MVAINSNSIGMTNNQEDIKNLIEEILTQRSNTFRNTPHYFVQIGAGAGDLDPRANFRDGFSEIIKKLTPRESDRIILVEPNPFNTKNLKESWNLFPNVEFFEVGISEKSHANEIIPFYYAEQDGPHYQVASFNRHHVLKHYRQLNESDPKAIAIPTIDLESFIKKPLTTNP